MYLLWCTAYLMIHWRCTYRQKPKICSGKTQITHPPQPLKGSKNFKAMQRIHTKTALQLIDYIANTNKENIFFNM